MKVYKNKLIMLVFIILLVPAIVSGANLAAAKPLVIKWTDTESLNSTLFKAAKYMGDLVTKRTKGAVAFEYYPQAVLSAGNANTALEQVQMGAIEAISLSTIQLSGVVPEVGMLSLPFLFDDVDDSYRLATSEVGEDLLALFDRAGLVAVGAWTRNLRQFIHGKKPLVAPADFKGQKIRVPEIKMFVSFFKALGAVVTPMTWGEVYTALQLGALDGLEQPTETIYAEKLYEVQKHVTISNYAGDWKIIAFNKKFWEALPKDVQVAICEGVNRGRDYKLALDEDAAQLDLTKRLPEKGMVVTYPTNEQKAAFLPYAEKVWAEFEEGTSPAGKQLLAKVLKFLGRK